MKNATRFLLTALALILLCGTLAITVYAEKWLEKCELCGGKGDYHCVACGNTGTVTCDGCGGSGHWECPGEEGKGKCDHGYYTCPSCNGDGKNRSGDGKIIDGNCGQCGGAGKTECWHCHGTGGGDCDRCNGTGKEECQVGTCKVSRAYGWKCPDCKGTGYTLLGIPVPPKSTNTGTNNVPEKGDWIFTDQNGSYYVYGGGTGTGTGTENGTDAGTESGTGVGRGTETSAESPQQKDDPPEQSEPAPSTVDPTLLPENRNTDFELSIPDDPARPVTASVRVETGKMTEKEQRYYAGLSEDELAQILTNVRAIVASGEAGRSDSKTDELLLALAAQNGYETLPDGRLFPLYFEGHQEIGFPVRVTVKIEKGVLDGGTDLYVYHLAENGAIELLGQAEYSTYEDGSVQSVSFYTASFSTFFTAAKQLNTNLAASSDQAILTIGADEAAPTNPTDPTLIIVIAAVCVAIGVAVAVIFLIRKKAKSNGHDPV